MTTQAVRDQLLAQGMQLRDFSEGNHKSTCPKCSHTRKKKSDPCLSVTIDHDTAVWNCHNCSWKGAAGKKAGEMEQRYKPKAYKRPTHTVKTPLVHTDKMIAWFNGRGITKDILDRNHVTYGKKAFRDATSGEWVEKSAIMFPYIVKGEVLNVKYRSVEKQFMLEKDCQLTFYGYDDVVNQEEVIIVEGEIDALSLHVAGKFNVVSVPNGTTDKPSDRDPDDNSGRFEYLQHAEELIAKAKKVIIATDNDVPGNVLAYELTRRIGPARCERVTFPDGCKDANDTLVKMGVDELLEALNCSTPCPIQGLHQLNDFEKELFGYYENGLEKGASSGFGNVDELMTFRAPDLVIVTGVPNSGKSELIDQFMVNLARDYKWPFAIFSAENPVVQHTSKLVEKVTGLPFSDRYQNRMNLAALASGFTWCTRHFFPIVSEDDNFPTIDWILDKAKAAVYRYGIKGLLIDPWNEIESERPHGMTETEYVSRVLTKIKRFNKRHGVVTFLVAHPTKLQRDKNGKFPIPTGYDISGSANFVNKADILFVVNRRPKEDGMPDMADIYVRKVRWKELGAVGDTSLLYNRVTGIYKSPDSQQGLFNPARAPKAPPPKDYTNPGDSDE